MRATAIIPARYASTRFPGKPLCDIGGKTMIQRVYEQAAKSELLENVIVATDDYRIEQHVKSFGGKVMLTSELHNSGTERCSEVVDILGYDKNNIVVNIQGDEPFINPEQIDSLIACFMSEDEDVQIATMKKKINLQHEIFDSNVVKVVCSTNGYALYFSRSPIPYLRGQNQEEWILQQTHYKHIGIYAYQVKYLQQIVKLAQGNYEKLESLEQLRWLENNYSIKVLETDKESVSIDTPEDLKKIVF